MPNWLVYFMLFIKVLQLIAFVFSKNVCTSWSPILTWWRLASDSSNLSVLTLFTRPVAHTVLYFIAVAIVLLLVGLIVFGVRSFAGTITVLWPLYLLRLIGSLVAGVLFIPLLNML